MKQKKNYKINHLLNCRYKKKIDYKLRLKHIKWLQIGRLEYSQKI